MKSIIWYNADEEIGEGIVLHPLMPKNCTLLRKGEGCWSFHFLLVLCYKEACLRAMKHVHMINVTLGYMLGYE